MDFGLWTAEEGTVLLNQINVGVRVCGVADIYTSTYWYLSPV